MKFRLFDLLICPECKGENLRLKIFSKRTIDHKIDSNKVYCKYHCEFYNRDVNDVENCEECFSWEIEEGKIECKDCNTEYPIIKGVPRMLPKYLWDNLVKFHKEFFKRYKDKFGGYFTLLEPNNFEMKKTKETLESYSYQWQTFDEMIKEWKTYFLDFIYPFEENFFRNKLCLDAGAGFGRFSYYPAEFGAEVVSMDLSEAVQSSYKNNFKHPFCYVVQGDIYNLPFKKDFDFIYSIGVIQHLPKKEEGFVSLVKYLEKKDSKIFIWVYSKRKGLYNIVNILRPITLRMPHRILNTFSFFMAILQEILILIPYKLLNKIPIRRIKKFIDKIPYTRYAHYPFRHNWADWFDRLSVPLTGGFTKEEIENWFKKQGLKEINVISRTTGWRAFGTKD